MYNALILNCSILSLSSERQVKEIQAKVGDSWPAERSPSPTECWQWFNLRMHNSVRPVTTGYQEIMDFFRALVIHPGDIVTD